MSSQKSASKNLHQNNYHKNGYDFEKLSAALPELKNHLTTNSKGKATINFSDPSAVKLLNKALLLAYYDLTYWDIPEGYLCPPVPGRSEYLLHVADVLAHCNNKVIPRGKSIRCLDIGVGANCIYPLVGHKLFNWSFVGSDIDRDAILSAKAIIASNKHLSNKIELRQQNNSNHILKGIFNQDEYFDLVICNPPFHSSQEEASAANRRKNKNLSKGKGVQQESLSKNFGGHQNELWCEGGEKRFITTMIRESLAFARNGFLFTTLIANKKHEAKLINELKKVKPTILEILPLTHGNKSSRILCWTFLTSKQQKIWAQARWR